jgi:hypothetical protein
MNFSQLTFSLDSENIDLDNDFETADAYEILLSPEKRGQLEAYFYRMLTIWTFGQKYWEIS